MKKYFYLATALVALAACSSNDYIGDQEALNSAGQVPISFSGGTPSMTRAIISNSDAATLLNNNFVLFGYKTVGTETQTVFDNYQVNFIGTSAYTSKSNSAGWEYVSYKNLPEGVGTNAGVTTFAATTTGDPNNSTAIDQSVKYWDFNASKYNFFAYSLGAGIGDPKTWAKTSAMTSTGFTLEGTAAQLGTCYVSNKKTMVPSTASAEVDLEFRAISSKIELKFYETIPGYSVKDVKFYPSAAGIAGTAPYLYAGNENALPTGGKYTVSFDDNGKVQFELATSSPAPTTDSKTTAFSIPADSYKGAEYNEDNTSAIYLGRASNAATSTSTITMLPNPQNTNALNLKMDFTLVSRDGSGETIEMKGASAVIPAAYAMWLPNYKYTYLFKISDNTNAKTAEITGLYPITLDAVVTDAEDGTQETVTTVDDPSITTYAKSTMVTANDEYKTGANIYIVVNDGTDIAAGTSAKLYTATITLEDVENPRLAVQGITEETVANALAHSGSVTDANGATLAVTAATGLSDISEIAATDAPNGHAITVDGVKFTPSAAGNYVFEYSAPAVKYTEAEADAYNATLDGAISTETTAYSFTSYGSTSGSPVYGTGKVKQVSQSDGWTTVLVTSNSNSTDFVGNQYKVNATSIVAETYYELCLLDGTGTGIYVKVASATYTDSEVKAYNAALPGAKSTDSDKIPAAKHYKVIKVVTGS